MQSEHQEKKPSIPNKAIILNLMLFRQDISSAFASLPADLTNYMASILSNLPRSNILDKLIPGLHAVCEAYKKDCYSQTHNNHNLACEVQEFLTIIQIERESDEKRAFVIFNVFLFGLLDVLKKFVKSKNFLGKLHAFLKEADYLAIYELACAQSTCTLFNYSNEKTQSFDFAKNYLSENLKEFQHHSLRVKSDEIHISQPKLIISLLCYASLTKGFSFSYGYLNNYLLRERNRMSYSLGKRMQMFDNLKKGYERYNKAINYPESNKVFWSGIHSLISKEIEFLLEQHQPVSVCKLTK